MVGKSASIFLAVLCGLAAAEKDSKITERDKFPEQFSQFTNQFQETFVNPSGGGSSSNPFGQFGSNPFGQSGSNPFGQFGQLPSEFPSLPQHSKRQVDTSQFSQFTNKFQETLKPPTGVPSIGSFPSPGANPTFFPQPARRGLEQFQQLTNKFQETFKPPTSGSNQFGFGNFPGNGASPIPAPNFS